MLKYEMRFRSVDSWMQTMIVSIISVLVLGSCAEAQQQGSPLQGKKITFSKFPFAMGSISRSGMEVAVEAILTKVENRIRAGTLRRRLQKYIAWAFTPEKTGMGMAVEIRMRDSPFLQRHRAK